MLSCDLPKVCQAAAHWGAIATAVSALKAAGNTSPNSNSDYKHNTAYTDTFMHYVVHFQLVLRWVGGDKEGECIEKEHESKYTDTSCVYAYIHATKDNVP